MATLNVILIDGATGGQCFQIKKGLWGFVVLTMTKRRSWKLSKNGVLGTDPGKNYK